jgi:hypothetical protein
MGGNEKNLESPCRREPQVSQTRRAGQSVTFNQLLAFAFALPPLVLAIFLYLPVSSILLQASDVLADALLDRLYLCSRCPDFTHSPSWGSWWHPQSSTSQPIARNNRRWNLLYHLGGNGPWIEKIDGVVHSRGEGIGPPVGCTVESVHMVPYLGLSRLC